MMSVVLDGGVVVKALLILGLVLAGLGASLLSRSVLPEAGLPGELVASTLAVWNPTSVNACCRALVSGGLRLPAMGGPGGHSSAFRPRPQRWAPQRWGCGVRLPSGPHWRG